MWDINSLLNDARVLMNYDGYLSTPTLVPRSRQELEEVFCHSSGCTVSAIYTKGVVYYDYTLDPNNIIDRSIMVHEMIHHIQRAQWGDTYTCSRWLKKERQAYRLQSLYLYRRGVKLPYIETVISNLKCPI